jgi:cytochrome o ubiquinol oxidase operon protein cyoD
VSGPNRRREGDVRAYVIGYLLALALTAAAFAAVRWPSVGAGGTFAIVLALALVQVVVQFRCFLHVSLARSSRDDLQLILFSTLIVILMVGGTLVILFNLRARMM